MKVLGVILLIVAIVVFMGLMYRGQENEIRQWASKHSYRIVEINSTILDNGPFGAFGRPKGVTIYQVKITDSYGMPETYWFRFGFTTSIEKENR